jgi:hypothetical protein
MMARAFVFLICSLFCIAAPPGAFAQACSGGNLVPQTDFCLVGTTMIGNGGIAAFKSNAKSLSVEAGDTIAGWHVTQVKQGSVTLQRDGVTHVLAMNRISTATRLQPKRPPGPELHDISPIGAGKVASVGTVRPDGTRLSISAHLPPVRDY